MTGYLLLYFVLIRRSYIDKISSIPVSILVLKIATGSVSLIFFPGELTAITIFWTGIILMMDLVLLVLYILFKKPREIDVLKDRMFWPMIIICQCAAIVLIWAIFSEFPVIGSGYASTGIFFFFGIQLNKMLLDRDSIKGQALWTGISKIIISATLLSQELDSVLLMYFLIGSIFFDISYIILFIIKSREEGINPLTRF